MDLSLWVVTNHTKVIHQINIAKAVIVLIAETLKMITVKYLIDLTK